MFIVFLIELPTNGQYAAIVIVVFIFIPENAICAYICHQLALISSILCLFGGMRNITSHLISIMAKLERKS